MTVELMEPVKVMAVFEKDVVPVKFKWRGRVYPVKEVTYTWRSKQGATAFMHFCVTDGGSIYELIYDTAAMKWSLGGAHG